MRRKDREVTDRAVIDDVISSARVCRIGLVDGEEAYIVPMNFGYGEGCLWFHSALEGRKVELIKRNGKATFEIDIDHGLVMDKVADKCTNHYVCVMGKGPITIVEGEEKMKGIRYLMAHYTSDNYKMTDRCAPKAHIFKLIIESMTCKRNP
ncbi:MAG: pyridoxamine 5'-phosphate oxidase family protein [Methanomassiliicoccales archaeon]|nr:MAG: pyridoxamine 5'-phosphate oxidase family protein [Methanomassiliicoccales archaeon]